MAVRSTGGMTYLHMPQSEDRGEGSQMTTDLFCSQRAEGIVKIAAYYDVY